MEASTVTVLPVRVPMTTSLPPSNCTVMALPVAEISPTVSASSAVAVSFPPPRIPSASITTSPVAVMAPSSVVPSLAAWTVTLAAPIVPPTTSPVTSDRFRFTSPLVAAAPKVRPPLRPEALTVMP